MIALVDPLVLTALALVAISLLWLWRFPRSRRIRLSGKRGTVYVFQDRAQPHLIKVGYTARLSKQRQGEVSRTMAEGGALRQLMALDMAHARSVETLAHRRLKPFQALCGRGREWYWVSNEEELRRVLAEVEEAAGEVRQIAQKRRRWNDRDEVNARRWLLTPDGPQRARLFQD